MTRPIYRLATPEERAQHPGAHTFREDDGTWHRRDGSLVGVQKPPVVVIDCSGDDESEREWLTRLGA